MDEEDATEIYNHLNSLDHNTKNAVNQLNKQVIINNNLIKNIDEINKHLNYQQKELNAYLSNITNQTNKIINSHNKSKYVLQLYADAATLNNQMEKLTDIILLSRLNVLAHDVLTDEEIERYNITVEIIPYIRNSVMFDGELLIFVICLPKFTREKYHSAIVVPFPNSQYEQLDTDNIEIIVQGNNIYNNDEKVFQKKNLRPHSDICIRNLLNRNNICTFKHNNATVVEKVFDNLIITKNLATTKLHQTCIDQEVIVKGNNVIKFGNCKIKINDQTFKNKIDKFRSNIIIPTNHLNYTKRIKKLTLEDLHLNTVINREQIDYVDYKSNYVHSLSLGINFFIIIVAVILILSKVLKKKSNTKKTDVELEDRTACPPKKEDVNPFAGTANT